MSEGYNGYSNYETWNACLWIDNECGDYEYWAEAARGIAEQIRDAGDYDDVDSAHSAAIEELATRLESEFSDAMPETSGMWRDILTAAFGSIDWREVAASRFDDDETFIEVESEGEEA